MIFRICVQNPDLWSLSIQNFGLKTQTISEKAWQLIFFRAGFENFHFFHFEFKERVSYLDLSSDKPNSEHKLAIQK